MSPESLHQAFKRSSKKGDVIGVARLSGIMAAKKTSDLIPLCHPLALAKVAITFKFDHDANCIYIQSTVKTSGQTGVEMEALTAVTVAALTIYDMLKSIDKEMQISDIYLQKKEGGKSGTFVNEKKKP
jgi:cyclic pyranopterin phosphate synthase